MQHGSKHPGKRRTRPGISSLVMLPALMIFSHALYGHVDVPVDAADTLAPASEAEVVREYLEPRWFFGAAAAGNMNFYRGTSRNLSENFIAPAAFHDGFGIRPFLSIHVEYHFNDAWGLAASIGYDSRAGRFDGVRAPGNTPSDLETNLDYFVFEPSLRFSPFQSGPFFFAGPRLSMNYRRDFTYRREIQHTDPVEYITVEDQWSEIRETFYSMQLGAGYDIRLSDPANRTQVVLEPFVSFNPYFGALPRNKDTWNITTVRAGMVLKVAVRRPVPPPRPEPVPEPEPVIVEVVIEEPVIAEPPVAFSVRPPILEERRITNEMLPLRNHVFFDDGMTEIPDRYVLLSPAEAENFTEEGLDDFILVDRHRRGESQMYIYYNILNILGDRMRKHPNTSIVLSGTSAGRGEAVGLLQANTIRDYLVHAFGINPARITTQGHDWPEIRSYNYPDQDHAKLRRDSDRRVEISSTNAELIMTRGRQASGAPRPVRFSRSDEGAYDRHVVFTLSGAKQHMEYWHVELTGPGGERLEYGPFHKEQGSVTGHEVLAESSTGRHYVRMYGLSKDSLAIERDTTIYINPLEVKDNHTFRFSMLYDFGRSETPAGYHDFLVEHVAPMVPDNARVIVHGHTDILGDPAFNRSLSLQRARDSRMVIQRALDEMGVKGISFEVNGYGGMPAMSPFPNEFPEEAAYNRTVIIDIVP